MMRFALPAALTLIFLAAPAFATGGFNCRPVSGAGPTLDIAVGHTISARPISVTLREGRTVLTTYGARPPLLVSQSWMDRQHLWLNLVDPTLSRHEAKLRATFNPKSRFSVATGTLVRGGRTYRVRCVEG
jgi:hypothetical protein